MGFWGSSCWRFTQFCRSSTDILLSQSVPCQALGGSASPKASPTDMCRTRANGVIFSQPLWSKSDASHPVAKMGLGDKQPVRRRCNIAAAAVVERLGSKEETRV